MKAVKVMVISGANIYNGGKLSIFYECLDSLLQFDYNSKFHIIAFVYKKELFEKYEKQIEIIELKAERKNYFNRFWVEYQFYYQFSKKNNIEIWLSLNDFSPRVVCKRQYAYYHNVIPVEKQRLKEILFEPKLLLLSFLWKIAFMINSHKNEKIIVQQEWIAKKLEKLLNLDSNKFIIALPYRKKEMSIIKEKDNNSKNTFQFIYPVYPRCFKNYELICEAVKVLVSRGISKFKVILTLDGTENRYANYIIKKYGNLKQINFIGFQTKLRIAELYKESQCLTFLSRIETWGLPISEFKQLEKPMILIRKPYVFETLGEYERVCFCEEKDAYELAFSMEQAINGDIQWERNKKYQYRNEPCHCWKDLWCRIIE